MVKNISYNYLYSGLGPWWYFSLALQFYILFPLLFKIIDKYKEKGLFISIALSYLLIYTLFPFTEKLNFPIYGILIGHLPEFLLGIGLARIKDIKLSWVVIIISTLLFILSNSLTSFFPFSFLTVTILSVCVIYFLIQYLPGKIHTMLIFIGKISMIIFLINGPMREVTFKLFLDKLSFPVIVGSVFHFILVCIISYVIYICYNYVWNKVVEKRVVQFATKNGT